ncbi:MAG: hypothetical protein LBV49_09440, partial [Azonexus sp.]|nr:hypothetical protein [Azonexus sp.]
MLTEREAKLHLRLRQLSDYQFSLLAELAEQLALEREARKQCFLETPPWPPLAVPIGRIENHGSSKFLPVAKQRGGG